MTMRSTSSLSEAGMTTAERIQALQNFGYGPQEARFLVMAALQSGYFLRRQFLTFVAGTKGWKDMVLIHKLKANRHCRITIYRHNRMVFHLSAKPLYGALGEPDNRNRREHQPSTIKNKIIGLDYVLEHPAYEYLATEREKLDYFGRTLKIASEDLPTRWYESPRGRQASAKYFADKYPMFLCPEAGTAEPVIHFCYVDEGLQSTDRFDTYLNQYRRLLAGLPDFRIIYIAQHDRLFTDARHVFEEHLKAIRPGHAPIHPESRELIDYFEMRRDYEAEEFSRFDTARLIRYRDAKKRFATASHQALYTQWLAGGNAAIVATLHPSQEAEGDVIGRFSTYVLGYDYDLFGTLTRGSNNEAVAADVQTQP
jgi:hypothetical protein